MILITGASGNIGSEVLKQAANKLKLRAAYTSVGKAKAAPAGVETVLMDFAKPETIRAALKGIEKALLVGPPAPNLAELENAFIDEAKRSGVKHLVYLSALGDRKSTFPGMHRDSEEKIEASGLTYTFLRPNGFMQNFVNYNAGTIRTQNAFYGTQGDGKVSHIDVRDIAAVVVEALSTSGHEGKAYSLTGPEALSNAQIAEKLSRVVGRAIRYVDLPQDEFKQALLSAGVPEWSVNALLDLLRFYREGGASQVDPAVEQLTGGKATSFDQFARDYRSAFQQDTRAAS
jgi:uncharacterized protein YbjT (DUF2867 family)